MDELAMQDIANDISNRMLDAVSGGRRWTFSPAASDHLDRVASALADMERPETARAVAHVTRLAMIYHLVVPPDADDPTPPGVVALSHLRAALAAWSYCSESAARVYLGDHLTDKIVLLARDADSGLRRTDIYRHTGNNVNAREIEDAIRRGVRAGKIKIVERRGGVGRPAQFIVAVG